jgi:S-formylglutathione hydrolase FrmB
MALLTVNFSSSALKIHTAVNVILPQEGVWPDALPRRTWPTLWLLHGLSDDHTIWQRLTAIERYVEGLPLAVVMPAVNRSFYQDTAYGPAYWSYVSEELPARLRTWFPLDESRAGNFVAGLSMGGYGALRLGLTHPNRYAAVASLSGATAYAHKRMVDPVVRTEMRAIYGTLSGHKGGPTDLFALAENVAASSSAQPRVYLACGTEDFLYKDNVAFHRHLSKLGIAHDWVTGPGDHTWGYWDAQIEQVVGWMVKG